MKFELHHVGCLTVDIEAGIRFYQHGLHHSLERGPCLVEAQKVWVCFLVAPDGARIELVQPLAENTPLQKLLARNVRYYHCGYWVDDIDAAKAHLESNACTPVNRFASEAFDGRECAFLFAPDLSLIEIIARS